MRTPADDGLLAKPGIADRCNYGRMPLFAFEGREPVVSPTAWIAPTATLIGDVRVEDEASVWYGAVLRADFGPIIVRRGANIQDGSVLHGGQDPVTEIGEGVTVGHLCVVHGAVIGTEALIGNGATVLDGAVIGTRALVAAGAVVPPGMTVPDGMLAVGTPARIAREVSGSAKEWVDTNPEIYRQLARRHSAGISPVHSDLQSGRPALRTRPANASASFALPRAGDRAARP
jgi:carbonic anhydrase/acetyltransferase-like protein (isoleucine patch superfamily)